MSLKKSDFDHFSAVDIFLEILKRRICYYTKKVQQTEQNMISSNGKLSLRLIRSKLRKREETSGIHRSNVVHPESLQATVVVTSSTLNEKTQNQFFSTPVVNGTSNLTCIQNTMLSTVSLETTSSYTPQFLYSSGNSQTSLSSNDQETLVHPSLPVEEHVNKKNIRRKLQKLVKRKSTPDDSYTIPVELRDQLKQIYVY